MRTALNPEWSIALLYSEDPLHWGRREMPAEAVLSAASVTDVRADFVADPFLLRHDDTWFMFFEVWNRDAGRGEIGLAVSSDTRSWRYQGIVLRENFHLSFPYVFAAGSTIYMVPETRGAQSIRLYRAVNFPFSWILEAVLLTGNYADSCIYGQEGAWWMFSCRGLDELQLFASERLTGPWRQHPRSPVVSGSRAEVRPAGRLFHYQGSLYRFAQDGTHSYGRCVHAFRILQLDVVSYREEQVSPGPLLSPAGRGWNADAMHHIDIHSTADGQWVAAVDGGRNHSFHITY